MPLKHLPISSDCSLFSFPRVPFTSCLPAKLLSFCPSLFWTWESGVSLFAPRVADRGDGVAGEGSDRDRREAEQLHSYTGPGHDPDPAIGVRNKEPRQTNTHSAVAFTRVFVGFFFQSSVSFSVVGYRSILDSTLNITAQESKSRAACALCSASWVLMAKKV